MKAFALVASIVCLIPAGCSSSGSDPSSAPSEKGMITTGSGSGYYAEVAFKERLYVLGTEKAHQALTESHQTPHIAKSYIGAGPDGQTVVLEADPKSNELQERLKAQYESRHGVKLP